MSKTASDIPKVIPRGKSNRLQQQVSPKTSPAKGMRKPTKPSTSTEPVQTKAVTIVLRLIDLDAELLVTT